MENVRGIILSTLLLMTHTTSTSRPLGAEQMQNADPISVASELKRTLSKLYPIEHWTMSIDPDAWLPFAPRFCWKFFRPDPETLAQLGEAIRNYKGSVDWLIGPPTASTPICLVAVKQGTSFTFYPTLSRPEASLSSNRGMVKPTQPTPEFIEQALADVPDLCSHLERYLKLETVPAKSFDSKLVAPENPPSKETAPFDFVERGMHVAWILPQGKSTGSRDRRMLHFSVTEDEWRKILEVLDSTLPASALPRSESNVFPLLSRIEELEGTYFKQREVEPLREECLQARARTSNPLAIRGLDKLILICNWADLMAGDISLRGP